MSTRPSNTRAKPTPFQEVIKIGYALKGVSVGVRAKGTPRKLSDYLERKNEDYVRPPKRPFVRVNNAVDPFTTESSEAMFEFFMQTLLKEDISEAEIKETVEKLESMCKVSKTFHNICKTANRWESVMNQKQKQYNDWGGATYYGGNAVDFQDFCSVTAVKMVGRELYKKFPLMTRLHYMAAIFGMKHNLKKIHLRGEDEVEKFLKGESLTSPVLDKESYDYAYNLYQGLDVMPPGLDLTVYGDFDMRETVREMFENVELFMGLYYRRYNPGGYAPTQDFVDFAKVARSVAVINMADIVTLQLLYTSLKDAAAPLASADPQQVVNLWTNDGNLQYRLLGEKDKYDAYAKEIFLHVMRLMLEMKFAFNSYKLDVDKDSYADEFLTTINLSKLDMNIDYDDFSFNIFDHYDQIVGKSRRPQGVPGGYRVMSKSYVRID